ncbi:MAG: RNA-binding protein [Micrococcales bacterium]
MLAAALEHLVKGIVDHPEDASVVARSTSRGDLLEIHVHPEDLGRVIGRNGRTATALRNVIKALADGKKVRVDVVENDF